MPTWTAPGRSPLSTPSPLSTAPSTDRSSMRLVITTSACAAASAGEAATAAPASRNGCILAAVRLYTVSVCPAFMMLRAMAAPMRPSPMNPTWRTASDIVTLLALAAVRVDADTAGVGRHRAHRRARTAVIRPAPVRQTVAASCSAPPCGRHGRRPVSGGRSHGCAGSWFTEFFDTRPHRREGPLQLPPPRTQNFAQCGWLSLTRLCQSP